MITNLEFIINGKISAYIYPVTFMKNSYIKFRMPVGGIQKTPENVGQKIIIDNIETIVPVANPDFGKKIGTVVSWLIEFEGDSYFPNREIGLNVSEKPIMIMPWQNNYGYWTDNNLEMEDFKSNFHAIDITREEFEKQWKLFESAH
jgi:hypothetical protein